jgi:hypothetical protein
MGRSFALLEEMVGIRKECIATAARTHLDFSRNVGCNGAPVSSLQT